MSKYTKKTLYIEPKHDKYVISQTSSKVSESSIVRQSIDLKIKIEQIKQKWIEDSKQWSKELKESIINNLFN